MHAYGPVPSRRLGNSLGVSPIPPKTCSYTCVYCQLGRTSKLQIKRESFFPKWDILGDIEKVVKKSDPDYITFVGDGEPALCKDLGWLIHETKQRWKIPTAVITNGSLLWMEEVRQDLMEADVVLPSLDAGSEEVFKKINRPHKKIKYEQMLGGMIDFSSEYKGKVWIELMLVRDVNDSEEALKDIRKNIELIRYDRAYVNIPIRPPAESWVQPPSTDRILRAQELLGKAQSITNYEKGEFGIEEFSNARSAILEICLRHPLREEQAKEIEKRFAEEGSGTVNSMIGPELLRTYYRGKTYLVPKKFVRR
ncbi:MAG TPA: radical SAM protein [Thermoplasmata archaeon]|nr:radical SAM protein [Thermoplasmata archaeon]